jgi:HD-like signal output (HDOD) protein
MSEYTAAIDLFRSFDAFSALADDDLLVLPNRSDVQRVRKRETLFGEGDDDPWIFCLLRGSLQLTAADGRSHRIDAGTDAAGQPLARLKPRKYTARAVTPAQVLRIDGSDLGDVQSYLFSRQGGGHRGLAVEEVDDADLTMFEDFPGLAGALEVAADDPGARDPAARTAQYALPSLPTVAMEALRVADTDDAGMETLAQVVNQDPAISAKLIRAANSPVFFARDPIGTCQRAIVRLGLKTTRQLVVAFAMRDLFKCRVPEIEMAMERLWSHSVEVAAYAFALARRVKGLDPGEAQLAGLLHDIGVVSILSATAQKAEEIDVAALFHQAARARSEAGSLILESWNFPPEQVLAVRDAEQWWRDDRPEPELADLVMVAQLMSFIGKPGFVDLPPLSRLPALHKLFPDDASVELVGELMAEAAEQVQQVRGLFMS